MKCARVRLGEASYATVASAARLAMLLGDRCVREVHLLSKLLADLRALPYGASELLVLERWRQDSSARCDPGLEFDSTATPSEGSAVELERTERELVWDAKRVTRQAPTAQFVWSQCLRQALRRSLETAGADDVRDAGPLYLLEGLLTDPCATTQDFLQFCRHDPSDVRAMARKRRLLTATDEPRKTIVGTLEGFQILRHDSPQEGVKASVARTIVRGFLHPTRVDPMLVSLELEAIRQAVRLGDIHVTTAHLLLAILALEENLSDVGAELPPDRLDANAAGRLLREHGARSHAAATATAGLSQQSAKTPVVTNPEPWWRKISKHRSWRNKPLDPSWEVSAEAAAERAWADAKRQGVRPGSSHLLIAALVDVEGSASRLLRELGSEPSAIVEAAGRRLP